MIYGVQVSGVGVFLIVDILSTVALGFCKSSHHVAPKHGFSTIVRKTNMDSFERIFAKYALKVFFCLS